MTQLKHPIDLLGAVKSSSGIACALAKTKEGGLVSVIWNEDKKDWENFLSNKKHKLLI